MSIYKEHPCFSEKPIKKPPDASFVYFDGITKKKLENPESIVTNFGVTQPDQPLSDSEKHRLVKTAKSPTPSVKPENWGQLPDTYPLYISIRSPYRSLRREHRAPMWPSSMMATRHF